jgi:hypothetical protein
LGKRLFNRLCRPDKNPNRQPDSDGMVSILAHDLKEAKNSRVDFATRAVV